MNILGKVSRNDNVIFVFTFVDEKDRDFWLNKWEECANLAPEDDAKCLNSLLSTLRSRTDDKYATKDHKFSGVLFLNEFVAFAFTTTFLMCLYENSYAAYVKYIRDGLESHSDKMVKSEDESDSEDSVEGDIEWDEILDESVLQKDEE